MSIKDTDLVADFRGFSGWHERFPKVSRPRVTGAFSIDRKRKYRDSLENLNYLFFPGERVHWDLNPGYEIYERKPEEAKNERINHILEFIVKNWKRLHVPENHPERPQRCLFPHIVAFRGLLRLLMCTPYEAGMRNDGWIILATKFKGTIYLCEKESAEKEASRLRETEDMKKFTYYGYKFEQYILTRQPNKPNDLTQPVIQAEEFAVAFQSTFAHHRLLYVAEIDGVISGTPLQQDADLTKIPIEFVEVKTKKQEEYPQQARNFVRYKLRNWWCQSFLVGIESVFVGVRDPQGVVKQIKRMQVNQMAKMGEKDWSGATCMNFCIKFLDTVRDLMRDVDHPDTVFKFSFNPRISNRVQYKKIHEKTEFSFLPPWYTDFINKL